MRISSTQNEGRVALSEERKIEAACVKLAEQHGCGLYKISFKGAVGFPDRMLVCPARPIAIVCLLEFKRPGGVPTLAQKYIHETFRGFGLPVGVVSSVEQFEEILNELRRFARLPEGSRGVGEAE